MGDKKTSLGGGFEVAQKPRKELPWEVDSPSRKNTELNSSKKQRVGKLKKKTDGESGNKKTNLSEREVG